MSAAWKIYDITVSGYGTAPVTAPSRGRALSTTWNSDAFNAISFGEFLKIARARVRTTPPEPDGYAYVRTAYGVDIHIGQTVTLRNEGARWNRREGVVLYPGPSTASVHVLFDGVDRPIIVHPSSIVPGPTS